MTNLRTILIAGALSIGFAGTASAKSYNLNFDDHEDILEQLIALDADGIDGLQEEFSDARDDIADALDDIAEAKEEIREIPFGGFIAKIAFNVASATVSSATNAAFDEVLGELDLAEEELDNRRQELGEAEYKETGGAIDMVRREISALEKELDKLANALDDL